MLHIHGSIRQLSENTGCNLRSSKAQTTIDRFCLRRPGRKGQRARPPCGSLEGGRSDELRAKRAECSQTRERERERRQREMCVYMYMYTCAYLLSFVYIYIYMHTHMYVYVNFLVHMCGSQIFCSHKLSLHEGYRAAALQCFGKI